MMAKNNNGYRNRVTLITDKKASFNYVEAFKSLRANVDFVTKADGIKTIMITSSLPEETKSSVVCNLGLALAEEGHKVCLIDCDLRKPTLHKYLRVSNVKRGLSDVFTGDISLADYILKINENLFLLPAGTLPPNPSELLAREKMGRLIAFLETKFDIILLDAPPISVVSDAAVLGRWADGALFVVRSKYASIHEVKLAVKKLEDVKIKIIGAILTRYDTEATPYSKSGYYYSYSNYYYKKGGED